MPSHIFTHVGAWADSAETNRRLATVAQKGNDPDQALHAMDYMSYAYLQLARDDEARKTLDEARTVTGLTGVAAGPYALAAMPARYALERGDWRAAAQSTSLSCLQDAGRGNLPPRLEVALNQCPELPGS